METCVKKNCTEKFTIKHGDHIADCYAIRSRDSKGNVSITLSIDNSFVITETDKTHYEENIRKIIEALDKIVDEPCFIKEK